MATAVVAVDATVLPATGNSLLLPSVARFNRAYFDFIRAARSCSPAIARTLMQNYSTLDKLSPAYLEHFEEQFPSSDWDVTLLSEACDAATASGSAWQDRMVFRGILLRDIADAAAHKSWTHEALLQHLGALHLFRLLHARGEDDPQTRQVLALLDRSAVPDDVQADDVHDHGRLDKDLAAALVALVTPRHAEDRCSPGEATASDPNPAAEPSAETTTASPGFTESDADALLEGTQLGRLAKDISERLDLASLGAETPEGLMGLLTSGGGPAASAAAGGGSGNGLSRVIEQVSGVLAEKFQSGEVNHMDLIRDAVTLAGRFASMPVAGQSGNNGLSDLMTMAMRTLGGAGGGPSSSSAGSPFPGPMADLVAQFASGLTDLKGSGSRSNSSRSHRSNGGGINKNRRGGRNGRGRGRK